MDAGEADRAAGAHGVERDRHELTGGREHDGAVARFGGSLRRDRRPTTRPSSRASSRWRFAAGQHDHLATPVLQHLEREVRRRAEPEQRDTVTGLHLGAPQRAVPDDARAQQRRGFEIVELPREAVTAKSSGTVTSSAYPPSTVHPVKSAARRGSPRPAGRSSQPVRVVEPGDADPVADREPVAAVARARRPRRRPGGRARSAGAPARGRPRRRAGRCGNSRTRAPAPAPRRGAGSGTGRSTSVERPGRDRRRGRSAAARGSRDRHLGHGTTKVASPLIAGSAATRRACRAARRRPCARRRPRTRRVTVPGAHEVVARPHLLAELHRVSGGRCSRRASRWRSRRGCRPAACRPRTPTGSRPTRANSSSWWIGLKSPDAPW